MTDPIDFAPRMHDVALKLLGEPSRALTRGSDWRYGSRGSLSIDIARGIWRDHEAGTGGGVLDLLQRELKCDTRAALEWLGEPCTATERPMRRQSEPKPRENKHGARALDIWAGTTDPRGTLAERYLTGRGLSLTDYIAAEVMRFHPRCPYKPAPERVEYLPALICLFRNIETNEPVAVQRILLNADGTKRTKASLGLSMGAAIMLSHPDCIDQYISICEGPETGLAVLNAGEPCIWALAGTAGMKGFPVLGRLDLSIYADADDAGRIAARAVAERYLAAGRHVHIFTPPRPGADFADMQREAVHG